MNMASWVILIFVIVWIGIAVKTAFFGGFGKKGGSSCHGSCHEGNVSKRADSHSSQRRLSVSSQRALPSDEELKLPSACMGCSKGSCSGCSSASARYDVPMPIIHETK